MKNKLFALSALIAGFAFQSANATDLKRIYQAPDYGVEQPVGTHVDWSGIYVGGRLGYGNANHNLTANEYFKDHCFDQYGGQLDGDDNTTVAPEDPFETTSGWGPEGLHYAIADNSSCNDKYGHDDSIVIDGQSRQIATLDGLSSAGVTGGIQLGADKQSGKWVFGVFGSYDFSNAKTDASFENVSFDLIEKGDEWSLGGRAGYLVANNTLLYGLLAYTQSDWDFITIENGRRNVTFGGVTFGGGLDHALTPDVFIGIEGTQTIYNEENVFDMYDLDNNQGFNVSDKLTETKVMATLKFKLNNF